MDKAVNAGVHNITGTDFQKHCVILILLERYDTLRYQDYLVFLEHHDDFLFTFFDGQEISSIESYQAKKASTEWTLTKKLCEVLEKAIRNGLSLHEDKTQPKAASYFHRLHFISNGQFTLKTEDKTKKPHENISCFVNETNELQEYRTLDQRLQATIKRKIQAILDASSPDQTKNSELIEQLDHFYFKYIDFPRQSNNQKMVLIGKIGETFGDKVKDAKAAVDALLAGLRNKENTFNQRNTPSLNDTTKRLTSAEINNILDLITTKSKAFELWREEKKGIAQKMVISMNDRQTFQFHFDNSVDFFKDLSKSHHKKIFDFVVKTKKIWGIKFDDAECLETLYDLFLKTESSQLDEIQIKAALFAAYVENKD